MGYVWDAVSHGWYHCFPEGNLNIFIMEMTCQDLGILRIVSYVSCKYSDEVCFHCYRPALSANCVSSHIDTTFTKIFYKWTHVQKMPQVQFCL